MATPKENVTTILNQSPARQPSTKSMSVFANMQNFESAQRMAKLLSSSTLIPVEYQDNVSNTTIALEMANRIGASPLAVMQNLYIVHGKPGWSAQFIIASLNSCGRYSPLRFVIEGEGDQLGCQAWAYDLDNNNERIDGPRVSISMAKAEGWYQKKGSKWQTMPDVMLRYRAASFFGKMYAPEILMGMQSAEELTDIIDVVPTGSGEYGVPEKGVDGVKSKLKTHTKANPPSDVPPAAVNTAVVDGDQVDTNTGEIIEEETINVGSETASANDKVKAKLASNKQAKTTNANNANPDQF